MENVAPRLGPGFSPSHDGPRPQPAAPRFAGLLAAPVLLAALSAAQASDRVRKLNGPLVRLASGDVEEHALTPDGTHLVFRADPFEESSFLLYAVPADGSAAPLALTGPGVRGGFRITPDSEWVVYRGAGSQGAVELFVAPLDGSVAPRVLSGVLVSGGEVQDFRLGADGARVVYVADQLVDNRVRLMSVPLDGSAEPVVISGPIIAQGDVQVGAEITLDGTRVVYRADQETNDVFELYSVPIDGVGSSIKLNAPVFAGSSGVFNFQLVPGGARVAYLAEIALGVGHVHSVPVGGGTVVELGFNASGSSYQLDPLGQRVVFLQGGANAELFSQPLDGSAAPTRLHPALAPGHRVSAGFVITPDGARVLFTSDAVVVNRFDLYSGPIDASSPPIELDAALGAGSAADLRLDPSGNRAVFLFWSEALGLTYSLHSVPVLGGAAPTLLVDDVDSFALSQMVPRFSADGGRVFYRDGVPGSERLYSVPIDGSAGAVGLSAAVGAVETDFIVPPEGARVFYRADPDVQEQLELFATAGTAATPQQLSQHFPALVLDGSVSLFEHVQGRAIYLADQDVADQVELYGVSTLREPRARKLNAPLVPGGAIVSSPPPQLTFDGLFAIYLAEQEVPGVRELFAVRTDGSTPPVKLNHTPVAGGDVLSFQVSANGLGVVYLADQDRDGVNELFVSRPDGLFVAHKLSGPLPADGDVGSYRISPDSEHVVFNADRDVDEVFQTYVTDGLSAPVQLSFRQALGGSAGQDAFAITPDGGKVVYTADEATFGLREVFITPMDGSARLKLGQQSQNAEVLIVDPNGERVVYLTLSDHQLYSAPLDGSEPATKLNDTPGSAGDVDTQRLSADGAFVVFVVNGKLFRVDTDGSSSPVLLAQVDLSGSNTFRISPDSSHVVFLLNPPLLPSGLWSVPADGSQPAIKLNPPLVNAGQVTGFVLSPDGKSVVFAASPHEPTTFGLYLCSIAGSATPPTHPITGSIRVGGSFEFTPSGREVLFLGGTSPATDELFAVPVGKLAQASAPR